jgi:hypothetical protein
LTLYNNFRLPNIESDTEMTITQSNENDDYNSNYSNFIHLLAIIEKYFEINRQLFNLNPEAINLNYINIQEYLSNKNSSTESLFYLAKIIILLNYINCDENQINQLKNRIVSIDPGLLESYNSIISTLTSEQYEGSSAMSNTSLTIVKEDIQDLFASKRSIGSNIVILSNKDSSKTSNLSQKNSLNVFTANAQNIQNMKRQSSHSKLTNANSPKMEPIDFKELGVKINKLILNSKYKSVNPLKTHKYNKTIDVTTLMGRFPKILEEDDYEAGKHYINIIKI